MPSTPRVFISYAHKDGEAFAKALRKRLNEEEPEIILWLDRAEMEGGVGWWNQIEEALDQVKFLVIVMTPAALQSEITRKEWRYARQRGVNVYPVKGVSDTHIDYKALPSWMRKAHFFDLEKEWETFVNYLKSDRQPTRVPFMAHGTPLGFVQRLAEFNQLLELLLDPKKENPVAITTVLQGSGGFGKSTLASALCHDERIITAFDDGILWVTMGQQPNLLVELTKCYEALTGEQPAFLDQHQASVKLAEKLENCNCLIVVDDVWKKADLECFFQGSNNCAYLITTRKFDVAASRQSHRIEVDEMTSAEATELLMLRLSAKPDDDTPFVRLARRLGNWPLLINLASGALTSRLERGDTLDHALAYVNLELDKRGVTAFDKNYEEQRTASVAVTLEISLGLLEPEERRTLAELAIFPEDAEIPLSTLACLWQLDELDTEDRAQKFADHALLDLDMGKGLVSQHDEIRSYLSRELHDHQGIHTRLVDAWGNPSKPPLPLGFGEDEQNQSNAFSFLNLPDTYAWRSLAYHLDKAGRTLELRCLLLDWHWIKAKLAATDINALINDYEFLFDDTTLHLLQGALRLSAHILAKDPNQLASQLVGRLLKNPNAELSAWVQSVIASQQTPWLRPLTSSLTPPGGPLLRTLTLYGHFVRFTAVALTPDGQRAVCVANDGTLDVWDLDSKVKLRAFKVSYDNGKVQALAVTPDGRRAVSLSDGCTLKVWDLESGEELRAFKVSYGGRGMTTLAVTPDGLLAVLSGSMDGGLKVWDLESGAELRAFGAELRAFKESYDSDDIDEVFALAVTPDGRQVVSGSFYSTLKVWDLESGAELRAFKEVKYGGGGVSALAVTPDGRLAVSGSMDGGLKVWDLESGTELRTMEGHSDEVFALVVTPDGRQAVSGSRDGTLKVWDLESEVQLSAFKASHGGSRVRAVAVTPDGRRAVSYSNDRTVKVWDLESGAELCAFEERYGGGAVALAMMPDGRRAVSGSQNGTLVMWNLLESRTMTMPLHTLGEYSCGVAAVAVTRDGRLAVCVADGTLDVWDLESKVKLRAFKVSYGGMVTAMVVTPDGRRAVLRSSGGTLKVWNLESGAELRAMEGHAGGIAVTPDGRLAVSVSGDGILKVWDLDSGAELRTLAGHAGGVDEVAVTPDGRWAVLFYSFGGLLQVWDLESGELMASFDGESSISACAIAPDNRTLVAGENSGRVHFLRLEGDRYPSHHP